MSLFKESGNDRFKRESQEMWNKISSEKTTKETEFSREKTMTTTSASQQKRTYEEQIGSSNNRSGLLNQSSSLLNGGPSLLDQTNQNIGRDGSRVGKIQRANGSDAQNDARTDVHNEQNARRERANVTNAHNEENIEEPFVAEVAHPRGAPGAPATPTKATPAKATKATGANPSPAWAPPAKPQPVDIFPRRRTSKFVKSKPAIWENEDIIKPLFAIEKKSRNKQNNTQTKQTAVKCSKK